MTLGLYRRLLLPLVPIYAGVLATKRWLQRRGTLPQRRLGHPVLSVGSLSAGGAGKTPVVLMLAELLGRHGFEVRILTRGYGRSSKTVEQVRNEGDAAQYGDEPLLMAQRAGAAKVFVGADRHQAGLLAERSDTPETRAIYLLDDGFQHSKLAREIDLVLLTRQDVEDRLLPAGNLREPLSELRRADILVLREEEVSLAAFLAARDPGRKRPVWTIRRQLRFPENTPIPARPVVFCGLARPDSFVSMLAQAGVGPAATLTFRDHHPYTAADIDRLVELAHLHGSDGFLTTAKDAVKLSGRMLDRLRIIGDVVVPELEVRLLDEQACILSLLNLLEKKSHPRA